MGSAMAVAMIPPAGAPAFLATLGWRDAVIEPLAGDASFRRYFRVRDGARCAVLMDAPPPQEDSRPFIAVARHLRSLGFAAPAIIGEDAAAGLVLLEDFGDERMRETVDGDASRETTIYRDAVTLLAQLHAHPAPAELAPYDLAVLHREVDLFVEWYAPMRGIAVERASWHAAWSAVFAALPQGKPVTVLRDYHAENIMLLGRGEGVAGLGLLDFQDALAGHPAYDLVSLLQDARRDVPEAVEVAMRAQYAALAAPAEGFDEAYAILGAQRNTKILGIFARLARRDGKPRYLNFMPRVWRYLERDLAHPALVPVRLWFDAAVPEADRAAAWDRA